MDCPLRAEPARHPIGRGWVWVRSGFDVFNKGMGVSVAMVLIWFAVGLLLERLPAGSLISQLLYMVWGPAGWRWPVTVMKAIRCASPISSPVFATS